MKIGIKTKYWEKGEQEFKRSTFDKIWVLLCFMMIFLLLYIFEIDRRFGMTLNVILMSVLTLSYFSYFKYIKEKNIQ